MEKEQSEVVASERGIFKSLAQLLSVRTGQVEAAVKLLDEGATVPFIARYRKEATGGLSDQHLRQLEARLRVLRELEARRATILHSLESRGKLTDELKEAITKAETRTRLEDLYLPFRPKRRTKARQARKAGLEPLALALFEDPSRSPEAEAEAYVDLEKEVPDVVAALEGARAILMERFIEDAELLGLLRNKIWKKGLLIAQAKGKTPDSKSKFADYFSFQEPIRKIPSHRALALFRGRKAGALRLTLMLPDDLPKETEGEESAAKIISVAWEEGAVKIAERQGIRDQGRPADAWLLETARLAWRDRMKPMMERDLFGRLRERSEEEAIAVFSRNLKALLLASPAGEKVVLGLDPGVRTGVKAAVVEATGKPLATETLMPFPPAGKRTEALSSLVTLVKTWNVSLVAIGNGTASRDTEKLVAEAFQSLEGEQPARMTVNEAGASVYSASELATQELPDMDVSLRGAVSIARRLQDPLAELVKIEPKSIGVGQYQHDVDQKNLVQALDGVVEDCVNAVGVDVNTASVALLSRVAGINRRQAENFIAYRDAHGAFSKREQFLSVEGVGPKAFEQAAGFLRIYNGDSRLDASGVHPESYGVVDRIVAETEKSLDQLIGEQSLLRALDAEAFVDDRFGLPTVKDILAELEKPGRDPRPEFRTPTFKEGVERLEDLEEGMNLEGMVTNVTNFGAFVDIGVHHDGLVHVSALSERFVSDPHTVVKTGDIVKVRVISVDKERQRIGLSMKPEKSEVANNKRPAVSSNRRASKERQTSRGSRHSAASQGEASAGGDKPRGGSRRRRGRKRNERKQKTQRYESSFNTDNNSKELTAMELAFAKLRNDPNMKTLLKD
ncbi:helix-hairpin-helix domain-containing protein [Magnetococcales bacterium HHB-1]